MNDLTAYQRESPVEVKAEKPTRVADTLIETQLRSKFAKIVYITSVQGFENYCADCAELLMVQETGSTMVPLRIFCGREKCVK